MAGHALAASLVLATLENNNDPFLKALILNRMLLDHIEMLPDGLPLEAHSLIDERLGHAHTEVVVVLSHLVANRHEVFVDCQQELVQINLVDDLLQVLGQLEQTLDDERRHLGVVGVIAIFCQQAEQNEEDMRVLAVFEHAQH